MQRGTKTREARLVSRKNDEAYVLDLTADVVAALDWHVREGYAGPEFRHATSRDLRSARQPPVNGKITGENPEGFARRVVVDETERLPTR